MKFMAVIIGDQTGGLLIGLRRKFELTFGRIDEMLLAAREQCLFKATADAFPPC